LAAIFHAVCAPVVASTVVMMRIAILVKLASVLGALLFVWPVAPAVAQEPSPWSATYAAERAAVSIGTTDMSWDTDQAMVTWTKPSTGGWQGSVERYRRPGMVDVAVSGRAYKRAGDWTFEGGASGCRAPHFLYRVLVEADVSRRVIGNVVATGGYRFMSFPTADVHQLQPAMTWYHARGEISARLFVTRNATTDITSNAFGLRAIHDVTSRVRLSGGVSSGTRIYDIFPLVNPADSRVGYGLLRIAVTSHDYVEGGVTAGRELPDFSYRSVILTYRRVF
jgi:YaiO family outer membrane protein